ncbi:hypothetical protein AB0A63_11390 [Lentzea sp. NPDC042327]|uniref:hypothetical protein n=1 Tax=Lentzea sp. NPDC042327 TaxID=3154801 RepID=UPI0033D7E838
MKRLIAAVLCLAAAACTTPAPDAAPPSTGASSGAPTTVPTSAGDPQAISAAFETYREAALAKDGAAALPVLLSNTFKIYDGIRREAVTGTEQTVATQRPSARLLTYAMRAELDHAVLRTGSPQDLVKTIIDRGLVNADDARDIALSRPTIHNGVALARYAVRGEQASGMIGFGLEDGVWKFDLPALFDLSDLAFNQQKNREGLTSEQLVDQLLTTRYGAARAAKLRTPLGA